MKHAPERKAAGPEAVVDAVDVEVVAVVEAAVAVVMAEAAAVAAAVDDDDTKNNPAYSFPCWIAEKEW